MGQAKKQNATRAICAQIKRAQSVEELSKFIRTAPFRIAGFKVDPDAFDDIEQEKLMVLEALVVRLREVIEADVQMRQSHGLKLEEDEEDIDFDYKPEGDEDDVEDEQ